MSTWNSVQENKARIGKGSGIYSDYFRTDGKFSLLIPTVETPFIGSEVGEVEIKVSSSDTVSKIEGVETLNAAETTVYMHRDTIRKLEKVNKKTINIISMSGDFTGYKSSVTVSYTPSNATLDDAWQGTLKLTPVSAPVYIDNCYGLLIPTAHFISAIQSPIGIDGEVVVGKTKTLTVSTKPSEATVTVKSEDTAIATVAVVDGVVTITGVKAGSTVITLTTELEGYESWETTTVVIVTAAAAA